ncbi:UDP-N-acetylmuramoylalanyl-D-glutamate--2, 6-diaminopimelate ligase (UDP-N-acetylmuramyl-tripeptide synthetase) (Meso-diaminopimelate-adding enzyme) (UDP-MurNAc-tripeptide synthetase) [Herminiimonas arsenicoxydans]|uniref:UDP-N-acetylmuramoyl-L-alanyl-D-glutamate--2,6-diaminopimelate ligase n=1 Tax=Herminiimonas arsenicoxydans TaxID=204773 RepID=A4G8U3_HERAR|nr:UDP-N-acetylmuramoylalanyl-D-glutamate--2, 6-diaminopimelate ligase (UDP-N-acetylmuramyl-tripeptide synthetase) (Meso-diaminopimelate-adding enzyme) (UDP-MurNAc-tripeptide synthetase) [Herminiimonas arsenicoxydans]
MSALTNTALTAILAWLQAAAPAAELASDSRSIGKGDVFLAYPGDEADGRTYISDAIERGAQAILYDAAGCNWDEEWNVPHLAIDNLRACAGFIAAAYYGHPDHTMFTVAVTGTNGKTSCSQWLGNALSRLGQPTAVIGTLGVGIFKHGEHGTFNVTGYTTPDAVLLQRELVNMHHAGATALAIEASSIGLHQGRLYGVHFDMALFTNFTRDHLDYHGDMAAYEAAKTMLFDWPGLRHAVVNLDDALGVRLVERLKRRQSGIGITGYTLTNQGVADIDLLSASDIRSTHAGTSFQLTSKFGVTLVKTQLVGEFNVSNVLGIIGILLAKGIALSNVVAAIEALTSVPGRMQQLGGAEAPLVVIDYAHTPDALEKTLATLREVANERGGALWCVFGCGGDRDAGKRPQMGKAAMAADHIIVTSDNPRHEEPASIIAQIVAGMDVAKNAPHIMEDRAKAILYAGRHAAKQDVILLAGKGHEAYQEIKGRKQPFLDADHAALALSARVMQGVS